MASPGPNAAEILSPEGWEGTYIAANGSALEFEGEVVVLVSGRRSSSNCLGYFRATERTGRVTEKPSCRWDREAASMKWASPIPT